MKYIAFYDTPDLKNENRYVNAAARGVIEYMIDVLSSIEKVEVISPGRTLNTNGVYKSKEIQLSDHAVLKVPFSFGVKRKIGRLISLAWMQIWLFVYLFFHTHKGEKVVFYHSLSLMKMIYILKKIKGIKPVLEFREIYSDINQVSKKLTKREHNYYKCAYAFIFPSEAIKNHLDIGNKPYVLAPGSYLTHKYEHSDFRDKKIHLVYAGNLRKDKGGAYLAADAAKHLPENYILHILSGSYSEKALEDFKVKMNEVSDTSRCKIVFEGAKYGEEFYRFLNTCDIGLATQNDGDFSNTSFPSKILTYMGCGLKVVAPPIDAVKLSPVGDLVSYYPSFDPKDVADAIKESASKKEPDIQNKIEILDEELKKRLKEILK